LVILSFYFNIEVSAGRIENVGIFLVASLCGWIFLKATSVRFVKIVVLSNALEYIGKHTMPILCLHVLSFKAVSLLYMWVKQKLWVYLASWHIIFDVNEEWKLLYLLAGVAIPIFLYMEYRAIRNKIAIV
jgi:fucose 4-O-acetylase-like acetyltransferase